MGVARHPAQHGHARHGLEGLVARVGEYRQAAQQRGGDLVSDHFPGAPCVRSAERHKTDPACPRRDFPITAQWVRGWTAVKRSRCARSRCGVAPPAEPRMPCNWRGNLDWSTSRPWANLSTEIVDSRPGRRRISFLLRGDVGGAQGSCGGSGTIRLEDGASRGSPIRCAQTSTWGARTAAH
jgi:hypothetical protein